LNIAEKKYIFIVGVGRSGTSLLQSMLATHPDICMLPETSFLRRYAITRSVIDDALINKILSDPNIARLKLDEKEIRDEFLCVSNRSSISFYFLLLERFCKGEKQHPIYIGDKDPRLIEYLPFVRNIFRKSHVINVVRDPRDILVSKKKASWSSKRHPLLHIFANKVQIELAIEFNASESENIYHKIVYEELLKNPKDVLKKLCHKLDISYDEIMLTSFGDSAKKLVDQSELSWKKETFGPLLTENTNKWSGVLEEWEVALIELSCQAAFHEGRYEISNAFHKLTWSKKTFVTLFVFTFNILAPLYKWHRNFGITRIIRNINNVKTQKTT